MKLISGRKLYRLGVGVALFMTGFLLYLVYSDISYAEINDVGVRSRMIGHSNPSEIYIRRERANQILPISDALSTSKRSHFKSAFNRNKGYDFISTYLNLRTTTKLFKMQGDFKSSQNEYGTTDRTYFESTVPQQQKYNKTFLLKHSNTMQTTARKGPSYSNNKIKITNNVSNIKKNLINTNVSNYSENVIYNWRQQYISGKDKAISNLNHSFLLRNTKHDARDQNPILKKIDRSRSNKIGKKYFVYLCDSVGWCGGWGDRQRGMTSAYHFSKLIGREFKIVMDTPCSLTQFYRPSKVNWLLKPGEIEPSSRRIVLNSVSKLHFKDRLKEGDFNARYPYDVIFIKTNQDFIKAAEMNPIYSMKIKREKDLASKKSRMRSAWRDLMQPSEYILAQLQELVGSERLIRKGIISKPLENTHDPNKTKHSEKSFNLLSPKSITQQKSQLLKTSSSSSPPRNLICAHVRMGKNPTIPMDEQFDSFKPRDIPKLLLFLQSMDRKNNSDFFLATDFEGIRQKFVQFFGNRLIHYDGKIIHIDRQRNTADACLGFGVALLDQLVLSVCDELVISRSGFSIHASYVSNSSHPVYIMEEGVIKEFKG